jgi:hypothetical protein
MPFSPRPTHVFLPKRPQKGPFLLSVRIFGSVSARLDIDGVHLTLFYEMASFRENNREFPGKHWFSKE